MTDKESESRVDSIKIDYDRRSLSPDRIKITINGSRISNVVENPIDHIEEAYSICEEIIKEVEDLDEYFSHQRTK